MNLKKQSLIYINLLLSIIEAHSSSEFIRRSLSGVQRLFAALLWADYSALARLIQYKTLPLVRIRGTLIFDKISHFDVNKRFFASINFARAE